VQIDKSELEQIINLVVKNTIKVLEDKNLLKPQSANEKTAYQKTEQLLYNYRGFCRIVEESKQEIEDLQKYGVPGTCGGVKEYVNKGGMPQGLVLDEERVEIAVRTVQERVQGTVQAITLIDKSMAALKSDPYYRILEMRYFEGRTQEDIAIEFKCERTTISRNKTRLVKELSMRLFPDQSMKEMLN
jgi:DNA-directed RNA polymerase specialized sigma24 family protein